MKTRIVEINDEEILRLCNFSYVKIGERTPRCSLKPSSYFCNKQECIFIQILVGVEKQDYEKIELGG